MNEKNYTVLIVDDNPKNLQVLATLLSQNNYNIEVANSGKAALSWLNDHEFDAVLLDIMMPEMDGYETCRQIKRNKEWSEIPVIFLTAREDIESITMGFQVGGVDYLTKPFNHDELLARLATHIELKESRQKLANVNQWLNQEVEKKTLELRQANEELRQLDASKNDFLKSISHEIRTPLNGICGSLNLLRNFSQDAFFTDVISLLDQSVSNLEKYSYAALQIANLQLKGDSQLEWQRVDWQVVIGECVKQVKQSKPDEEIDVVVKPFPDEAGSTVDFEYLCNAIEALLFSSLAYSKEPKIIISMEDDGDYWKLIIEDNGSLFNGKKVSHFFDSINNQNYQFERNNAMELYLAKIIIQTHKGDLSFENKADKSGTRTLVTLSKS
ncbi:hybrid sensor histidine kinase/response regulator [Carboxylicivirga sp. M1479]|uniref:hybrid sensor histidine kinase/response regulator n=1 Tax=Carboxylicivirga sp. M1479 TaxID=2594476 RepID=UPI001178B419|nr:hybrid sensor histidine kinase/response regulator [Carboxylicivirga sp. M1479]TRX72058.1 hybrid sensor histidine kinase/response regulator [Carboxylicivirga sp. M1479]